MGRPQLKIDPRQVEEAIAQGNTVAGTAHIVGCGKSLLETRFHASIEKGRDRRNSSLQKKQFDMAVDGNATMLIWLGKQWLRQADKQEVTATTP
ncbi:hypothetical protein LCGC14_1995210 [marine sediment metagenome]|uniref:Uncharacterized protein n=1 Tax=marine sediment metagenome TaxID=412755 RepID=A0A0F9FSW7_9ZZZZ